MIPEQCAHKSGPDLIQLELSRDARCFTNAIAAETDTTNQTRADRTNNLHLVTANTRLDFGFIALYWLTFLALASLYALEQPKRAARLLFTGVAVAISVTAACDIAEDFYLLRALSAVELGRQQFTTPGTISTVKWCMLGVSAVLLGFYPIGDSRWRRRLLGGLLIIAGAVIVWGTLAQANPSVGMFLLTLALVLAIVLYSPGNLQRFILYAYLLRFPVITALLLAVILPSGYFYAPSIFYGLFDAIARTSFFLICYASFLLALIVMITARLILVYAPERFPDLSDANPSLGASWWPTTLFSLLAAPMIAMTWVGTQNALSIETKLLAVLLAALGALVFLVITALIHALVEDPDGTKTVCALYPPLPFVQPRGGPPWLPSKIVAAVLARALPKSLQTGLLRKQTVGEVQVTVLRSGHRLAGTALLTTLAIYLVIGIMTSPTKTDDPPAAMVYVILLLCLFAWFFSGISFFLDRLRIPVLTTVFVSSMLLATAGGTDHVFELKTHQAVTVLPPDQVIKSWATRRSEGKNLVVVATAGGGIRASAWTAQVLTGLATDCTVGSTNRFLSSVVLISSVSGGSEGAMYFTGLYDGQSIDANMLKSINREARASDLGAVGWGLVYPDLLRTVPGSNMLNLLHIWPTGQYIDRGWALEEEWTKHWARREQTPTLAAWNDDVAHGARPANIFNATVSETGNRFIAATTGLYEQPDRAEAATLQFFSFFPSYDLSVATAARLSATFPYVSPMARAETDRKYAQLHFGDGGYYDNSGMLSAVQWLMGAGAALDQYDVYLLIIDSASEDKSSGAPWTWQRQILAPVGTLMSVRTSSQQTRGKIEQDLLQKALNRVLSTNSHTHLIPVRVPYREESTTPLSWHLNPEQTLEIDTQWADQERQNTKLDSFKAALGCRRTLEPNK
ncbi:patatin-like phospholipase family protein [Terriglobus albidus]|uniref:patatin-like phospholipase family protein n=1 Tax=Terriglobus albidus TaxID=1592106 RepID=UPI0021E0ACC8|nr:patatin-like phospholipase family protein [Terriglobus albidus]